MQAYQRKRHRLLWVFLTAATAIALFFALSNRGAVRSLLDPKFDLTSDL